jgi:hypothetical protein
MVEKDIKIILPRLENALKQNIANEVWESVTGEEHLLPALQHCAALKWYEHKVDLTGEMLKYDADFAVALRKRAKERRDAIERTSGLLGETGFDLHRTAPHLSDIQLKWEKEVLFGGKAINHGHILVDSGANSQFLTKDNSAHLDSLLDEDANKEFLETHYKMHRYKDGNLINSEEYEEFLKFKAGQRENGRYYYAFDW